MSATAVIKCPSVVLSTLDAGDRHTSGGQQAVKEEERVWVISLRAAMHSTGSTNQCGVAREPHRPKGILDLWAGAGSGYGRQK